RPRSILTVVDVWRKLRQVNIRRCRRTADLASWPGARAPGRVPEGALVSRVQLALRVSDLDASVAFYSKLFGAQPAKRRPGYANFALAEPPLKLVLTGGEPGAETVMDHLGVEVETVDEVNAATARLTAAGLVTSEENDTSCCYAVQDKV